MEQPSLNDHNKQEYPPMHTTEHVINRTMVNLFGCGRAISAHIERKKSKLDFALQTCPEEADIIRIENTVNEVLRRNLPVTMEFISQEEAIGRFDMKRLPEKASETVRIVKVGDYDECLCIGQHVKNTSEIGEVKIKASIWQLYSEQNTGVTKSKMPRNKTKLSVPPPRSPVHPFV